MFASAFPILALLLSDLTIASPVPTKKIAAVIPIRPRRDIAGHRKGSDAAFSRRERLPLDRRGEHPPSTSFQPSHRRRSPAPKPFDIRERASARPQSGVESLTDHNEICKSFHRAVHLTM